MSRCEATTKRGHRCLNSAIDGSYCSIHRGRVSSSDLVAIGLGALIGNAVLPGIGGALLGSVAGSVANSFLKEDSPARKRVFVSFDFDNDRILKDFILGQAKNPGSPFEVIDHSLKEAAPEKYWEQKAAAAISRADIVLVIVGPQTYRAQGVLKEVEMARKAGVKIVQIIGYKDGDYTPVPNAGRLYAWNWENLKNLLS